MRVESARQAAWLGALTLHAALLWPLAQPAIGAGQATALPPAPHVMLVRSTHQPSAPAQAGTLAWHPSASLDASEQQRPLPDTARSATLDQTAGLELSALASAPAAISSDTDHYTPASQLDERPTVLDAVMLPSPEGLGTGRWLARLDLFIDEAGTVQRIRMPEGDDLPGNLADATRQAFLSAQFAPGRIAGLPVKTLLPIEVEFVNDEPSRTAGVATPGW